MGGGSCSCLLVSKGPDRLRVWTAVWLPQTSGGRSDACVRRGRGRPTTARAGARGRPGRCMGCGLSREEGGGKSLPIRRRFFGVGSDDAAARAAPGYTTQRHSRAIGRDDAAQIRRRRRRHAKGARCAPPGARGPARRPPPRGLERPGAPQLSRRACKGRLCFKCSEQTPAQTPGRAAPF
ncbi:MAG: hypothetical protein J3K34DRAFT_3615 [Monoraphidium minutum]|nr:MAG: hypothetical protein J3K34DRAFT_3615 [Monoraphidium minutum]